MIEELKARLARIDELIFVAENSTELTPWISVSEEDQKEKLESEFGGKLEGDVLNIGGDSIVISEHISLIDYKASISMLIKGMKERRLIIISQLETLKKL